MGVEQRQSERKRVLQRGKVVFRDGHSVIDCIVLDLSREGARLKGLGLFAAPDAFELRFDRGNRVSAVVCYRNTDTLGVRFVDPAGG